MTTTTISYPEIYREIREWFISFVRQYDDNDPVLGSQFRHKKVHTEHVCEVMKELTRKEGFSEEDSWIALICARLHDTSRFEQTLRFQTYNDADSFDHGARAIEVLKEYDVLTRLPQEVQELIFLAITWHNKLVDNIPSSFSKREYSFITILRDADKLDNIKEEVEIRSPLYAQEIASLHKKGISVHTKAYDSFMENKCVNYADSKNAIDRIFLITSWVFDLNTKAAFELCKKHDWFNKLIDFLPENASYITDMREIVAHHIEEKLS